MCRKVLSLVIAVIMIMSVFNIGISSYAVESNGSILKEIVLEPTPRPQVQFYCTDVTRVAAEKNSMQPGNQIVKATPSGIPELSGEFASQAYAGETPEATRITFVTPTAGVSITRFSCDNSTVTFSDMSYIAPGTYLIDITGGTAEAGTALTFTVDYTWTDGNTYQEKCVTYVENIATGGAFAELRVTWKPYSGNSSWYRGYASAITRVLGKGVYYEMPADTGMTQKAGSYNVATKSFSDGSGLTTYYEEERVESSGVFSNPRETIDHTKFITGTSQAHIYIDASVTKTLSDINLRIDSNVGNEVDDFHVRNNDSPNVALGESYVYAGAQTTAPTGYSTNEVARTTIGYSVPERSNYGFSSENGAYSTITSGTRNGGHILTSYLNGDVQNLVGGSAYTVINRYYAYFRGSYAYITNSPIVPVVMNFHVVDKGALRELVNYVMTSDPDTPSTRTQKKGANPQAWYYRSGFSAFQNAYVDAVRVLNNPKATQAEIDASTKSLQTMYNNLQLKTADYTRVNELYDIADAIIENEEAYPASDIALIMEAQEGVTKSYSILYQSAVDTMAENLQIAIDRAMPNGADYGEINALKTQYAAIDKTIYEPETISAVDEAFAKVDYSLTALEQKKVDAWANEIKTALDNLVPLLADFTVLEATLQEAKNIDRSFYINSVLLDEPIAAAEAAVKDNEKNPWIISRQSQVDALTRYLREVIDGLILKSINKTALKEAIDREIPGVLEYYDQEILGEYELIIEWGTRIYNDNSLTIYDQGEVDGITNAINLLYDELMSTYDDSCKHLILNEAVIENYIAPDYENKGSYDLVVYCSDCGEEVSRETVEVPVLTDYFGAAKNSSTVIDKERMYIYGLDIGLNDIESYVEYSPNVTIEISDGIGTGSVVTTYLNGEEWENYIIIIFGDLNSDGVIDIYDSSVLAAIINGDMEVEEDSELFFAADLNNDTAVDIYDLAILNAVVNGEIEIEQVPYI